MYFYIIYIYLLVVQSATATDEEYRLPNNVIPNSYQVHISVGAEAFTEVSNEFTGQAQIELYFLTSTNYVALHAHHDYIKINRILFDDTEITNEYYNVNNVTDILTINFASSINTDNVYTLVIDYTGVLSTTDMYGFYKSSYTGEDGSTKYLATTFFSPVHARRAFPCFDEPAFKATFNFSFTHPSELNAFSNMQSISSSTDAASGLTTTIFKPTPKMSTFVLAFIITDFTCTFGASVGDIPLSVCSRNDTVDLRSIALEYAPQLLESLNNYTNYDYGEIMEKLDQFAIPDFAPNAMENWGLITYRETALLWSSSDSSYLYIQRIITVMAHELAHQWFGNLVSPNWWSAVFLKEGFATYFEYHTAHDILPDWELDKQFVLDKVHAALTSDALENAPALESACYTQAEIIARFNTISYSKGGSILRMVEHFMGAERFKEGIRNYLTQYQFENVEPKDVWLALNSSVLESFTALPDTFVTVMSNWIIEPGYPVLQVNLSGNDVTITQKRFLFSGETSETQWYVPISYSLSVDPNKFERTAPITWLVPGSDVTFTLPTIAEWIILNNQQSAYYRVNYDETLWMRISNALLKDNFDGIAELNRAQIVDDLFNLARAGQVKYSGVLDIIKFLENDTSYFPWHPAFSGFDFLLMRVGEESTLGKLIAGTILELLTKLYDSISSTLNETNQIYTLKQSLALKWGCRLGNEHCVNMVQNLFGVFKSIGQRPHRTLRSVTYCYGLRYSTDSTDWDFLWNAYNSTNVATEKVTIISALGCTNDESTLERYLRLSITEGSGIRTQDALSVFSSVYTGSSVGVDVAFDFLINNYEIIAERYNSMNSLGNLIKGIAERFTTKEQIDKLVAFIANSDLPEPFLVAANEALETAQNNLNWLETYKDDLLIYYGIDGSSGSTRIVEVSIWISTVVAVYLANIL